MIKDKRWINRILYCFLLATLAGGVLYLLFQGDLGRKEIGTAFLAMVGTFVGALFAFRLNETKEDVKRDEERKAALQFGLFVLLRQHNALRNIVKHLQPYKSEFNRAFNCPAFHSARFEDLVHDFTALSFLLDADPTLVLRLSVEQVGFHQTVGALEIRNQFYVSDVLPKIAEGGLNHRHVEPNQFKNALGERLFETAINYANGAYKNVALSLERNEKLIKDLHAAAKKLFPHEKFTSLQFETSDAAKA